jgi:putative aminopeptidase FrvX
MNYSRAVDRHYNKDSVFSILSQPTAPFREEWVRRQVQDWCRINSIPQTSDPFGNMWVNVRNLAELANTKLLFVAHMDHPGIVIHDFPAPGQAIGEWLGGGPKNIKGCAVKLFSTSSQTLLDGVVEENEVEDDRPTKVTVKFSPTREDLNKLMPWGACLWFSELGDSWKVADGTWTVRAADDLFLVCVLLHALSFARPPSPDVAVLLTRSEEKGLIGSYFAASDTPLTCKTKVVSVDLTDAQEKGVMVRWKDKGTELDESFAEKLFGDLKGICDCYMQTRTSKGKTDSTAFSDLGFCSAGLSIPLKNYHNKKGKGAAPEEISENDRLALMTALRVVMGSGI